MPDARDYLNSQSLSNMMKLLYSTIIPAHEFFYESALDAVSIKNDKICFIFEVCMTIYIIASCAVTLFIWIPYIQEKKMIVWIY